MPTSMSCRCRCTTRWHRFADHLPRRVSAATAMVIVASAALAIMVSNDMILLIFLRQKPFRPSHRDDFAKTLLHIRRSAIRRHAARLCSLPLGRQHETGLASIGLLARRRDRPDRAFCSADCCSGAPMRAARSRACRAGSSSGPACCSCRASAPRTTCRWPRPSSASCSASPCSIRIRRPAGQCHALEPVDQHGGLRHRLAQPQSASRRADPVGNSSSAIRAAVRHARGWKTRSPSATSRPPSPATSATSA